MKRLFLTLCLVCAVAFGAVASDFATFEVSGKVSKISGWYPFMGYVGDFNFSSTGKLTTKKGLKIKRNQQGKIVKVTGSDADFELSTDIKYDSKGRLLELKVQGMDGSWTEKYEYDAKGRVVKVTKKGWSEDEEFLDVDTFKYNKFDAKGNWISRTRTTKSLSEPGLKPYVAEETRQISYYK